MAIHNVAGPVGRDPDSLALHHTAATERRILIVEDHTDTAEVERMLLRSLGYQTVQTASHAAEAIRIAKNFAPHIILLDLGLPQVDGFMLAREFRRLPDCDMTFILAVSGYGRADDVRRAIEAGCNGHLLKPISLDQFRRALSPPENQTTDTTIGSFGRPAYAATSSLETTDRVPVAKCMMLPLRAAPLGCPGNESQAPPNLARAASTPPAQASPAQNHDRLL